MNPSNAFTSMLAGQRRGELLNELAAKMAEAVLAVRDTGKAATVTLELKLSSPSRGEGMISLSDKVKCKLPQMATDPSMFYMNDDGTLTRTNPNQRELELKSIPGGQKEEPLKAAN